MRSSDVLITDRLRKKMDGKARVFYHPENVPFGTPVVYQVFLNGDEILITNCKKYALAYADGCNHLHVFKGKIFPLSHVDTTGRGVSEAVEIETFVENLCNTKS